MDQLLNKLARVFKDKRERFLFALIFFWGLLIYWKSLWAGFYYDDFSVIIENAAVKHLIPGLIWNYDPARFVTNFTFAINYVFGQLNVTGWHAVNLMIHCCNAFFVFTFVKALLQTPKLKGRYSDRDKSLISVFTALVFLCHPIQTQAVIYLVQRSTLLATMFFLLTLRHYIEGRLSGKESSFIWALAFCFIGVFTKPIFMVIPIVIAAVEIIFFGIDKETDKKNALVFGFMSLPLLVIPLFLMGLPHLTDVAVTGLSKMSLTERLMTQPTVIMTYLRLLVVPAGLNLDYDFQAVQTIFHIPTIISLFCILCIFVFTIRIYGKNRLEAFGIMLFFITLSQPVLFPLPDVIFEHWVYLPSIGFILCACAAILKASRNQKLAASALITLLIIFSAMTYSRASLWQDNVAFLEDVVRKSPNKARAQNNLGLAFSFAGDDEKARAALLKAIEADPSYVVAWSNLADNYYQNDEIEKAKEILEKLVKNYPDFHVPFVNLGKVYEKQENYPEAVRNYNRALELSPSSSSVYVGLANIYQKLNKLHKAKVALQTAMWLRPDNSIIYYNLGNVLLQEGEYFEALFKFEDATKIDPMFAKAHNNMGNIYFYFESYEDALEKYNLAVKHDPELSEGHFNLANTLYAMGKVGESHAAIEKAIQLYEKEGKTEKAAMIKSILNKDAEK